MECAPLEIKMVMSFNSSFWVFDIEMNLERISLQLPAFGSAASPETAVELPKEKRKPQGPPWTGLNCQL